MTIKERAQKLENFFFQIFKYQWQQRHNFSETSNLNIKEVLIVNILAIKDKSLTMSELAGIFSIPPTTMTNIVDRLVEKNYLKRFRSREDRRVVKISLSSKGEKAYKKEQKLTLETNISLLNKLPKKEQENLIQLLKKLIDRLPESN